MEPPPVAATEITPLIMHQMAARLASAMAFLERRGIIHRDVAVSHRFEAAAHGL